MKALPSSLRPPVRPLHLLNLLLAVALLLPAFAGRPAQAQGGFNLPYGFIQESVVLGLDRPTSFALLPDGRILIAEKSGVVRVAQDGQLLPDPFIDISTEVNDSSDRGLLGITVHPDWPNTPYVYLAYTYDPPEIKDRNPAGARVSRVLRLSADPNDLNKAVPGSGVVILGTNSTADHVGNPDQGDTEPFSCFDDAGGFVRDCIAAEGTAHSMDFVRFGPDGALYVSDGDGIVNSKGNSRALNPDSLNGKILRINPLTGEGYPDNPFFDGDPNSNRSKVFAMGMRNPFRFTVDPRDGQVIVGDVGNNNWEEINRGGPGSNFGWPCYEGPYEAATYANCDAYKSGASPVTMPVYSYPHSLSNPMRGSAIGGDLYLGSAFPALYRGAYFYHDFNGGVVDFLTFNSDGSANDNEFATNVPGVVQMTVGDDGALYVISIILGGIWRIRYAPGGNKPPTADATADPMGGPAPLEVNFSSKRSTDPEKSIVGYQWDFGDGGTSSKANPTYTYKDNGVYTAVLTVTDSAGATATDSLQIAVGSSPPVAQILEPGDGAKFRVGQTVNFKGKATDAEDGDLSGSSLKWSVTLHHLQHLHYDFFNGEGESGSFRFDDHGDDTYLELCLTATDSAGLQDTECSNIKADEVTYTFNTVPAGLPVTYAGSRYETPFKVKTYIDAKRIIEAPAETKDGLRFDSWSDGGEAVHEIVVGESPQTLTATYVDASGTAAGDQATSDQAAADAALVTPEDTGQTTGTAHTDDGHDHAAASDAATPEPTPEASTSAGDTASPAESSAGGQALVADRWSGVGGTTVEELTKSDAYRKQAPSQQVTLDGLQLPRTGDKDYGVRIRGYLVPPVDGDYRFWIAADDRGAFFLSTDDSPDNKIVVAYTPQSSNAGEYEKNPEQITGPIALKAGERYFFEVLYKQGDGKDNLSVAWQIPGTFTRPQHIKATCYFYERLTHMRYSLCSYSLHRTVDAGKMDAFGYNRFCKTVGYTQLDPWNYHIARAYDDNGYLAELKASGADVGLPYGCIAVDDAHIYEPSAEARAENQQRRYRWLEIAAELGAEQLRIDAGGRDQTIDEILPIVVEGYKDIVARAKTQGVEIIIENHWGPTNHPDAMRRLLSAVPGLGLLFDSYNWPAGTHSRAWREYVGDARLTHFKTFSFDADGNEPNWDIPGLIRMLQAAGYQGAWGIESTPDDGDELGAAEKSLALLKRSLEGVAWR